MCAARKGAASTREQRQRCRVVTIRTVCQYLWNGIGLQSAAGGDHRGAATKNGTTNVDDGETLSHEPVKYDDPAGSEDEPIREDQLRAIAEEVRSAFPRPLTEAELVLIDVDPRRLHAFWNLPLSRIEAIQQALPPSEVSSAPMVLRISHADGSEPFDVEVQGLQSQTYVDIWDEERSYRATLGLRLADGSLAVLIEGGTVTLPRTGPLPHLASTRVVEPPAYGRMVARGVQPVAARVPAVGAGSTAGGDGPEAAASQPAAAETLFEPFASPPVGGGEHEPALLAGDAAAEPTPGNEELTVASEWVTADGGARPLELENALTLSSYVLGRESVQLEVNAELRVFGRTRPGSELKLFGRRVAVRPDGTFSITRPLPNGALVLTALLTGADDDQPQG